MRDDKGCELVRICDVPDKGEGLAPVFLIKSGKRLIK